jgi:predicted GH43/DUF377 family glycosyl hydrolase
MRIEWQLKSQGYPISGLDLGSISIIGNRGSINTNDDRSLSMTVVAAADFLSGLYKFLTSNLQQYEFIATDSSFQLIFKKNRNGLIDVFHRKNIISEEDKSSIWHAAVNSVKEFTNKYQSKMNNTDNAWKDLKMTLEKFAYKQV